MNTYEGWNNHCQIGSPSEIPEKHQIRSRNRDPFNASTVKNQQPAQFYRRFLQNYILNHNHGGQAQNYSINVPTDLHPVCEQLHLRPNLLQLRDRAKDTTCMSISDQWFLWSGSRPMYNSLCERHGHVDINFSWKGNAAQDA